MTIFSAGFLRFKAVAVDGRPLSVSAWYPSCSPETRLRRGIYDLSVAAGAEPAAGKFGLVVFSHGSGGGEWNHHDWAESLARSGYVVIAPRHVGDGHGAANLEWLVARTGQLGAAVAAARGHEFLGTHIGDQLGVAGFSAGGCACLNALMARTGWGAAFAAPQPVAAAALFAPFAANFVVEELSRIETPMRVYRAEHDSIIPNSRNADVVIGACPRAMATTVPGDHYVFIAPVADDIAARYPKYYRDLPGVDRRAIHTRIARELTAFFDHALSAP